MTTTVGIDLSAEPKGTAIVSVVWHEDGPDAGKAVVGEIKTGAADDLVLHWLHHPDQAVGIDCPLGWPTPFVELVSLHASGSVLPGLLPAVSGQQRPDGWRREFFMRRTDLHVRAQTGIVPLSVSGDRIAHAAVRLAAMMSEVGDHIDRARDGSGAYVEVYPAAALKVWGLTHRGYKKAVGAVERARLFEDFRQVTPWLILSDEAESLCIASDDVFDALICALIARAAKTGHTISPAGEDAEIARQEGWIHLPADPLPREPWHSGGVPMRR